jgi:hypothetical protein
MEGTGKAADTAMELGGGFSIFERAMIERLFRYARLGRMHSANAFSDL